jgi:uncharacterized protein YkwD
MKKIAAGIAIAALIPTLLTGCIRKVEETPKETTAQPASSADTEAVKTAATEADGNQALKEATSGGKKAPGEAHDRAKAEEVVRLVNEERKRLGLNELVIDEAMMTAAETRAKEQKTLFSHTRPDGTSCFTVFDQFEIPANYRGENLASGGKCTPDFVMKMWIASEGHYKNIKHEKFTRIGVGYFESGKYGYWAQLFAN